MRVEMSAELNPWEVRCCRKAMCLVAPLREGLEHGWKTGYWNRIATERALQEVECWAAWRKARESAEQCPSLQEVFGVGTPLPDPTGGGLPLSRKPTRESVIYEEMAVFRLIGTRGIVAAVAGVVEDRLKDGYDEIGPWDRRSFWRLISECLPREGKYKASVPFVGGSDVRKVYGNLLRVLTGELVKSWQFEPTRFSHPSKPSTRSRLQERANGRIVSAH